jgi:hypothetical protein
MLALSFLACTCTNLHSKCLVGVGYVVHGTALLHCLVDESITSLPPTKQFVLVKNVS